MKICFSLFSLLCLISIPHAFAQKNPDRQHTGAMIDGTVKDAVTGQALEGASLYFSDIRAGAVTNKNGHYKLQNIPEGKHLLEVSFLGYASQSITIDLRGEQHKDFALHPSIVENETVTITGVSSATTIRKSPVPVNILRKTDLLKISSTNLIDALSKTPGVSQISTGPAISKPTIRGLGYNRLVVIGDGVRQEGQQWGDEHGIEIDEFSVAKAEVLKGPASIMYGSDALAGVINLISSMPVADSTIRGNLLTGYQSNNAQELLNANIAGNQNGLSWNLYGTMKSAKDYKNAFDGRVFNSRFNERNGGLQAAVNKSWGYSHLVFSLFNQEVGLTEGARDSASGRFTKQVNHDGTKASALTTSEDYTTRKPWLPKQEIRHLKFSMDNSLNIGKNRLSFILGYQRNQRMEFGDVVRPQQRDLYFDLRTVTYNFQYHFSEINNWKSTIGINGLSQDNRNKGIEALIPEYGLFDLGGFFFTRKTMDKLTISGGIRMDNRAIHSRQLLEQGVIKFEPFSTSYTNVSGSAGLSYEISNDITVKLNLARGFRAPAIPELASHGAHEGTNRFEYGDRNLQSETSLQADLGLDANSPHVSFSANMFLNAIDHFIFYRKLSAAAGGDSIVMDRGEEKIAFRFDQGNAYLYGAELNLDLHPHPLDWLHIENTFSYVRGLLNAPLDGSRNLPFIPAPRLINQVRADISRKGNNFRNIYISAELDNTFSQSHPFTGYQTETATPGYSLLNIGAGTDVLSGRKTLFSIYFSANNITDKAYQNHLSRLKYTDVNNYTGRIGVFNMGRNFSVKLNIPFTLKRPVEKV